jgi:hypothetical protein
MSDKLKQFISENEQHFDSVPTTGHFERFKRLQEQNITPIRSKKSVATPIFLKVAAILVLVFGIGWMVFNLGKIQGAQEFNHLAQTQTVDNQELSDAEFFFSEQVNLKKKEVLAYASSNNDATQQIMQELEKLELQFLDLKEELAINNNNEQIINSMIENYRMRLSVLERLLKHLKKSNVIKQKHHEDIQA